MFLQITGANEEALAGRAPEPTGRPSNQASIDGGQGARGGRC